MGWFTGKPVSGWARPLTKYSDQLAVRGEPEAWSAADIDQQDPSAMRSGGHRFWDLSGV